MLRRVQSSHRPIIITQNGKAAGVLISPVDFNQLCEQYRFIQAVQSGLSDVEQGRVLSEEELARVLDEAQID